MVNQSTASDMHAKYQFNIRCLKPLPGPSKFGPFFPGAVPSNTTTPVRQVFGRMIISGIPGIHVPVFKGVHGFGRSQNQNYRTEFHNFGISLKAIFWSMKISIICFIFNLFYYVYFHLKSRYPIFSVPVSMWVGMFYFK